MGIYILLSSVILGLAICLLALVTYQRVISEDKRSRRAELHACIKQYFSNVDSVYDCIFGAYLQIVEVALTKEDNYLFENERDNLQSIKHRFFRSNKDDRYTLSMVLSNQSKENFIKLDDEMENFLLDISSYIDAHASHTVPEVSLDKLKESYDQLDKLIGVFYETIDNEMAGLVPCIK